MVDSAIRLARSLGATEQCPRALAGICSFTARSSDRLHLTLERSRAGNGAVDVPLRVDGDAFRTRMAIAGRGLGQTRSACLAMRSNSWEATIV